MAKNKIKNSAERETYSRYLAKTGYEESPITTALIDMDGVLYDSMTNHNAAWMRLAEEMGWKCAPNEFYLAEGMTGAAIIRVIMERECGRTDVSDEEAAELYAKKAQYFKDLGEVAPIDGAAEMLCSLRSAGITRVLVTGSGQHTLLDRLNSDYPGIFSEHLRVTALDVKHGKPNPEPYLMGLKKAGSKAENSIVIENAPLGVKAGSASGCFTIGITTGPIPADALYAQGADIVYPTMRGFAEALPMMIAARNYSF